MSERAPSSIEGEIEAFFTAYVEAFARGDAVAVSELWEPVGLFPLASGNFAMDRPAFREHCARVIDFYRGQGVTTPVGKLLSAVELFPNVALARMAYRMLGRDGELIAAWEHVYVLRRTGAGGKTDAWLVSLTIADDEIAAWARRTAQS